MLGGHAAQADPDHRCRTRRHLRRPSSSSRLASTTSRSSIGPRGGRHLVPQPLSRAARATCRRSSTRSRSSQVPTGRGPTRAQPEIRAYLEAVRRRSTGCVRTSASGPRSRRRDGTSDVAVLAGHDRRRRRARRRRRRQRGRGCSATARFPDIDGLDSSRARRSTPRTGDHDHDLTGERVAVIGSAARAVQLVPELASDAGRLIVFQRRRTGCCRRRTRRSPPSSSSRFVDGSRRRRGRERATHLERIDAGSRSSDAECPRRREEAGRGEPRGRRGCGRCGRSSRPTSRAGCKRPLFSNDYYPTFNRPTSSSSPSAIERITPTGVVTVDGAHRVVDTHRARDRVRDDEVSRRPSTSSAVTARR